MGNKSLCNSNNSWEEEICYSSREIDILLEEARASEDQGPTVSPIGHVIFVYFLFIQNLISIQIVLKSKT